MDVDVPEVVRCAIFRKTEIGFEVLLVRRANTDTKGGMWELPGGGVEESDESAEAAIRREVEQETGLQLEHVVEKWKPPVTEHWHNKQTFFASVWDGEYIQLSDEHDAYTWEPLPVNIELPINPLSRQFLNLCKIPAT